MSWDSSVTPFVLSHHPTPALALDFIAAQSRLLGCSVNLFTPHRTSQTLTLAQQNIPLAELTAAGLQPVPGTTFAPLAASLAAGSAEEPQKAGCSPCRGGQGFVQRAEQPGASVGRASQPGAASPEGAAAAV